MSLKINLLASRGYTQLNNVRGTGTQWIRTPHTIKANTSIKCGIMFTNAFAFNFVYGAWGSFALGIVAKDTIVASSGGTSSVSYSIPVELNKFYEIEHTPTKIKIGSNQLNVGSGSNLVENRNIFLFGASDSSLGNDVPYYWYDPPYGQCRMYYFKIYEGDTLVAHYIPARHTSTKVLGMYDIVSNTFLTNGGSDTLGYGTVGEPSQVVFNGSDVKQIIFNGVSVWNKSGYTPTCAGFTWYFKENISSMPSIEGNLNFSVPDVSWWSDKNCNYVNMGGTAMIVGNNVTYSPYGYAYNGSWSGSGAFRRWVITGGSLATNTTFLNWLYANATIERAN